jgi:hypothetical protein
MHQDRFLPPTCSGASPANALGLSPTSSTAGTALPSAGRRTSPSCYTVTPARRFSGAVSRPSTGRDSTGAALCHADRSRAVRGGSGSERDAPHPVLPQLGEPQSHLHRRPSPQAQRVQVPLDHRRRQASSRVLSAYRTASLGNPAPRSSRPRRPAPGGRSGVRIRLHARVPPRPPCSNTSLMSRMACHVVPSRDAVRCSNSRSIGHQMITGTVFGLRRSISDLALLVGGDSVLAQDIGKACLKT